MSTWNRRTCIPQHYGCNASFHKLYLGCCKLNVHVYRTGSWTSLIGSLVFVHVYRGVNRSTTSVTKVLGNRNSGMCSTSWCLPLYAGAGWGAVTENCGMWGTWPSTVSGVLPSRNHAVIYQLKWIYLTVDIASHINVRNIHRFARR